SDGLLTIDAKAGGSIELYDPIEVNQVNFDPVPTLPNRTFKMEVLGNGGDFFWGGDNVFQVGTYNSSIHSVTNQIILHPNSRTILLPGMTLHALMHDFVLEPDAYLEVSGYDDTGQNNALTLNSSLLEGTIKFNTLGQHINDPSHVILTITTPSASNVNISNATIEINGFEYGSALNTGDTFYLMEIDETTTPGQIIGEPQNTTASAMQNSTIMMTFAINKTADGTHLVAQIEGVEVIPETKTLSEGYVAGLAFLAQIGSWLPDYTYQTAELAIRNSESWQAFAGFDASTFKAKTGSHVDVQGVNFVIGIATKRENSLGNFLFGLYVQGGVSNYDVFGDFNADDRPAMEGGGHIRSLGAGIMASQKFNNNFRLELSGRTGTLENNFKAENYPNAVNFVSYDLNTTYFGGHFGIGYEALLNDFSRLDLSLKYYFSLLKGKTLDIGGGDKLIYEDSKSHRVRGGTRYTRKLSDSLSFYGGAYYDYEFTTKAEAKTLTYDLEIVAPELKGGSGVFELGGVALTNDSEHLSVEFGLQGYVGILRGFSGGIRFGYEF
ncbi:MAG: hypothetical protein LBF22_06545, partial [Deltaproteobacteria bacterium]|nr:hypothetical protein [Deltaproteobacteria bacterium]